MSIRSYIGNTFISIGLNVGEKKGKTERTVKVNDHSIKIGLKDVDDNSVAWDSNLYTRGNLFLDGYANPIKPRAEHNIGLSNPDKATVDVGEGGTSSEEEGGEDTDETHTAIISSSRYQEYMRQDLASQLLNPREQWRIIAYAVIALAILQVIAVTIGLSNAGVF